MVDRRKRTIAVARRRRAVAVLRWRRAVVVGRRRPVVGRRRAVTWRRSAVHRRWPVPRRWAVPRRGRAADRAITVARRWRSCAWRRGTVCRHRVRRWIVPRVRGWSCMMRRRVAVVAWVAGRADCSNC